MVLVEALVDEIDSSVKVVKVILMAKTQVDKCKHIQPSLVHHSSRFLNTDRCRHHGVEIDYNPYGKGLNIQEEDDVEMVYGHNRYGRMWRILENW